MARALREQVMRRAAARSRFTRSRRAWRSSSPFASSAASVSERSRNAGGTRIRSPWRPSREALL